MAKVDCSRGVHMIPRLLSIADLVNFYGQTPWFWRSRIWDGDLKPVGPGRKYVIDRLDVESFIQQHKMAAA